MTVSELSEKCSFEIISMPNPSRQVKGCYIGDLLSWVMGRAKENEAWITIMSNINTVAVASLADVSVVILSENVKISDEIKNAAVEKGINIVSSSLPSYETAIEISGLV